MFLRSSLSSLLLVESNCIDLVEVVNREGGDFSELSNLVGCIISLFGSAQVVSVSWCLRSLNGAISLRLAHVAIEFGNFLYIFCCGSSSISKEKGGSIFCMV